MHLSEITAKLDAATQLRAPRPDTTEDAAFELLIALRRGDDVDQALGFIEERIGIAHLAAQEHKNHHRVALYTHAMAWHAWWVDMWSLVGAVLSDPRLWTPEGTLDVENPGGTTEVHQRLATVATAQANRRKKGLAR